MSALIFFWDPFTNITISKLERVQNKAVRFIFNRYDRVSVSGLVAKANLKHTSERNKIARLRFMFKIVKGHLNGSISNYVNFSTGYDTRRRHSLSITPYQSANNVFKYSFFPRTIVEWNALDAPTVETNSIEMFDSLLASRLCKVPSFVFHVFCLIFLLERVVLVFDSSCQFTLCTTVLLSELFVLALYCLHFMLLCSLQMFYVLFIIVTPLCNNSNRS